MVDDSSASRGHERRGAIDVARSTSLVLVVVAHLVMVVIDRGPGGAVRGINLFQLYPRWEWLTALSPMPLFFVASGWANVGGTVAGRARRVTLILTLAVVLSTAWSAATLVERVVTGGNGIVSDGARVSTQPLWFLAAWIPFTLFADSLTTSSRRIGVFIVGAATVLVVGDVARFVFDAPRWVGFTGFFVAWAVPWALGSWWRQQHDAHTFDERVVGLVVCAGAITIAIPMVAWGGYSVALIDAVPGGRSNTTPPTLFTAVASTVQFGAFMACAPALDRIAARRSRVIRQLDTVAPGLYVWHLTALSLLGALLAAGLWAPHRLSPEWWLSRPLWWAAIVALAIAFALASRTLTRVVEQSASGTVTRDRVVIAAFASGLAFALAGLYGPDTTGMAIAIPTLALLALWAIWGKWRSASR